MNNITGLQRLLQMGGEEEEKFEQENDDVREIAGSNFDQAKVCGGVRFVVAISLLPCREACFYMLGFGMAFGLARSECPWSPAHESGPQELP